MSKQVLDVPEEELAEYREAFNLFDKDGSGTITTDEFIKVLKNLGQKVSKEEAEKICTDLDADGSGEVDFDEFVSYMQKMKAESEELSEEDKVKRAFRTFDLNGDGTISKDEFRYILKGLGDDKFSEEEVDQLFREADIDNDQKLNYNEFVDYWRNM